LLKITKLDIVEKFININLMRQQALESPAIFFSQTKKKLIRNKEMLQQSNKSFISLMNIS